MLLTILLIITGLFLLKQGASWFVRGSSDLARLINMSELAIGLTIVAIGTSAPELVVNSFAATKGTHDIVTGNIIGSNIFNLFIILSIVGIISPVKVQSNTAWKEIPFSFFVLLILFLLVNDQLLFDKEYSVLSRIDASLLVVCFILFMLYSFRLLKNDSKGSDKKLQKNKTWKIVLLIVSGLICLIGGGKLVIDNSVELATRLGLSEKIIGLTIVAAGTSLPELATSIVAVTRNNNDIALGNIIGSNIFNILFILPVSSFIRPLHYNTAFNTDLAFISAGTLILFIAMYTGKRKQIDRWEVIVLLIAYIIYMIAMLG